MHPSTIHGDGGTQVDVTTRGQLVVAPHSYSEPVRVAVATTDITNLIAGKANCIYVVTDITITQDKTNADVETTIFQATDADTASVKDIYFASTIKSDRIVLTGLNWVTDETRWINFQHDSGTATISVTIAGYYIDA